jgi:hypothetical protein
MRKKEKGKRKKEKGKRKKEKGKRNEEKGMRKKGDLNEKIDHRLHKLSQIIFLY